MAPRRSKAQKSALDELPDTVDGGWYECTQIVPADLAAAKLTALLTNDPAMGVFRHVDAGYDRARGRAAGRDNA